MEQITLDWGSGGGIFTVSELSAAIRVALGNSFGNVFVAGEISGVKPAASGHIYFTLKDPQSQIRCVCFRGSLRWLRFKPQEGIAVVARGRLDVYESRGEYQLIVDSLEPQGFGALQAAFEQLKRKLAEEGLFDGGRKRALPRYPRRIGIVTSPSGAVIRDILHIVRRRFHGVHVRLYPAQVQGSGSVEQVVEGIRYFSSTPWADTVIVCRGGGSIEDLWTFNEEPVARAIAECSVPVISAVGHETDFTIADFVADVRAPTPSAAAELVIHPKAEAEEQARQGAQRAARALHLRIARASQRVDGAEHRIREGLRARLRQLQARARAAENHLRRADPRLRLAETRRRLDSMDVRSAAAVRVRFAGIHRRLDPLAASLVQLSPLHILKRGYAIATGDRGEILRDAAQTGPGRAISVRLASGKVRADVTGVEPQI